MPSAAQSIAAVGLFTSGLTAGPSTPISRPPCLSFQLTHASFLPLRSSPPGLTLSYPLIINPLFRQADSGLSLRDRLRLWERGYENGLAALPLLALATAAIFVGSDLALDAPILGRNVGVVSGLLHVSIIPFTVSSFRSPQPDLLLRSGADKRPPVALPPRSCSQLIAIRPVNNVLMGMRKAADAEHTYAEADVAPLFARWAALHNVRVALSAAGFALALLGTLGAVRL